MDALVQPITFEDKSTAIPLQAPDVLAYEAMKHQDNQLLKSGRPRRKSYEALMKGIHYFGYDYDIQRLEEFAKVLYDSFVENGEIQETTETRLLMRAAKLERKLKELRTVYVKPVDS